MPLLLGLAIAGVVAALFLSGGFFGATPHPVIIVLMVLGLAGAVAAMRSSNAAEPGLGTQRIAITIGLILLVLAGVFFLLYRSGAVPLG